MSEFPPPPTGPLQVTRTRHEPDPNGPSTPASEFAAFAREYRTENPDLYYAVTGYRIGEVHPRRDNPFGRWLGFTQRGLETGLIQSPASPGLSDLLDLTSSLAAKSPGGAPDPAQGQPTPPEASIDNGPSIET